MNKFIAFLLLISGLLVDLAGDYFMKKWALSDNLRFILIGLLTFAIANVFWAYTLKYEAMSKIFVYYSVLVLIAGVILGTFIFKEKLLLINWVGVLLAIIGMIFVSFTHE